MPSDEELYLFYNNKCETSFDPDIKSNYLSQACRRKRLKKVLKDLEKEGIHSPGVILDTSAHYGFLLEEAERVGWDVVGVEISKEAHDYIKENLKDYRVYNENIYDFLVRRALPPHSHNKYDVIFALGFLDHVKLPRLFLQLVKEHIVDDGVFVFTCVNTSGFLPFRYCPPEHLHYYNKGALRKVLLDVGFTDIKIKTYWIYVTLRNLIDIFEKYVGAFSFFLKLVKYLGIPNIIVKIPSNEIICIARKR
ncbi:MAG: class I SAM-dependent methyltransferase [Colwellia sp.]|nr:class I SAM-dependent methyltransferase [Colwellia sp.]